MATSKPDDKLTSIAPVTDDDEDAPTPQMNTQPQSPSDVQRDELSRAARTASARTTAATAPDPKDEADSNYRSLLRLTGYKDEEVIGYSATSQVIVTENGGKYLLRKSGKTFRRISGPLAPSERPSETAEEDE